MCVRVCVCVFVSAFVPVSVCINLYASACVLCVLFVRSVRCLFVGVCVVPACACELLMAHDQQCVDAIQHSPRVLFFFFGVGTASA